MLLALVVVTACAPERPDPDSGTSAPAATDPSQERASDDLAASFTVTGTNSLTFDPDEITAPAGTIEFALTCDGAMHDLVILETGETVAECMPGETDRGTVTLDSGTYTFQCTVPGHARMTGSLTVE